MCLLPRRRFTLAVYSSLFCPQDEAVCPWLYGLPLSRIPSLNKFFLEDHVPAIENNCYLQHTRGLNPITRFVFLVCAEYTSPFRAGPV